MSTSRRRYTPEFKLEAVRLISDQGQRVKDVAESLGVHPGLLHQWRAAVRANGSNAFSADAPAKLPIKIPSMRPADVAASIPITEGMA